MRKLLFQSIILAILLSLLAACAPVAGPAGDGASQEKDIITLVLVGHFDRGSGHPWERMVNEYNEMQDEVEVQWVEIPPTEAWFQWLGTRLAAGNPPDVMNLSVAGLYGAVPGLAGDIPLVVDASPWMDEEYLADLSWCQDSMQPYGKRIIWPMEVGLGEPIMLNVGAAEEAGVDWQKIQKEGWTLEEFREVAKALTKDTDGDGEIDQWGYANALEWWRGLMEGAMHSAGIPSNSGPGFYMWGNEVDWAGDGFVAWLDLFQKMVLEDGSIPEAALALPPTQPGHELWYNGEAIMTLGYPAMLAEMEGWNEKIDSGEIEGNRIEWEATLLPLPHMPPFEAAVLLRCHGLSVFKQEPYKGDEHTAHAMEFARFLSESGNMKEFTDFRRGVPARISLLGDAAALADPRVRPVYEWKIPRATCTFPMGHPLAIDFRLNISNKWFVDVVRGSATPEEAVAAMAEEVQENLDEWVTENPELAEIWATPWRADWPECYYVAGSAYPEGIDADSILE